MARFNVTAPDGSIIPVDAPAGATEQDAIAFAASTWKPSAPGISAPRKTGTVVDQIPGYGGPVPAATEPVRTKNYTIGQKLAGAAEVIPALVTGAVTAPIVEASKIYGAATSGQFGTQAGIRAGEETGRKMQAQFYQPRTQAGQEYVGDIANAMASTGLQGVPMNVLADLSAGLPAAGRAVKDLGQAKIAQRAENIAQRQSAADWARAPQIEAAQAAQRLGVAVNPAEANPNVKTKMLVGATGEAVVNDKIAKANAPKWNDLARKDLGLPENTQLTPEAFEKARSVHSAPYDAIKKIDVMQPSAGVMDELNSLKLDPRSTSSPEKAAKVNAAVDRVMTQAVDGLSGENVVSQIRDFRKDANQVFKNPNATGIEIDVAEAQLGIANALENLIEGNLSQLTENGVINPRALDQFRTARTAIAKTYDWERATEITTKQVNPAQIVKLAEKGKPLTGVLADVANVAGNFPDIATLRSAKEPLIYQRLRRGGAGGTIGGLIGGIPGIAIGAGLTSLGSEATANMLARPGVQNRLAIPADRRLGMPKPALNPAEGVRTPNQPAVYDWANATAPNFTMPRGPYGAEPNVQFGAEVPPTANMLGYGGTMETLAAEKARAAGMSRTLGQQAEAQQAAAEAAARQTASGGTPLMFDTAGNLIEVPTAGAGGVMPSALESAVQKMSGQVIEQPSTSYKTQTISPKTGAQPYTRITKKEGETTFERGVPQAFAMTAEEKIAWNKAKADLAEVVPGMRALDDKAVAAKMMDREWLQEAIVKAKQKAKLQDEIVARSESDKARRLAMIEREKLDSALETLEEQYRKSRPVQRGGQGPKTRAFQRNMLTPEQEIQNALAK